MGIALIVAVLWDSWADAALWDLLGLALWGSLFASSVLTSVGVVRRSPWTLMLAALLSMVSCGLVASIYTPWTLAVPVTQVTLATMMGAARRVQPT